jgi:hypothetical protein
VDGRDANGNGEGGSETRPYRFKSEVSYARLKIKAGGRQKFNTNRNGAQLKLAVTNSNSTATVIARYVAKSWRGLQIGRQRLAV